MKNAEIMAAPDVRYWVKEQYKYLLNRDPLDALADARLLASMIEDRVQYLQTRRK